MSDTTSPRGKEVTSRLSIKWLRQLRGHADATWVNVRTQANIGARNASVEAQGVALTPQPAQHLVTVRRSPGLQVQQHLRLIDVEPRGDALVYDVEDVDLHLGQLAEQVHERARMVAQPSPEHQVAAGQRQPVPEHLGQQQWVDVAPGQDRDDRRLDLLRPVEQRRDAPRAGRLYDLLGAF